MRHFIFCAVFFVACGGVVRDAAEDAGDEYDAGQPYDDRDDGDDGYDASGDFDDGDAGEVADAGDDAGVVIEPVDSGIVTVDAGTGWDNSTALLRPSNPMPCADPAVVSSGATYFVFCTGMSHVWKTTNWINFSDVRAQVTFDLTGMSANGKLTGAWWAPGIVYSAAQQQYVMFVSVPDAQGTNDGGWDTRSIAVLTATTPNSKWTFKGLALDGSVGQQYIDPFPFIDHDGQRYVYWKQYGGGLSSSIMGARADAAWTTLTAKMEVMDGYGGAGTWEDNVRENPAVWFDAADNRHHLIFSGGHWRDDSYATGHAISSCGPLCPAATSGGWHMRDSGDRSILQVVRSPGNANFTLGGPGGAVFLDDSAQDIIYAAAAKSVDGITTRFLMRDRIKWLNKSPYVDTTGHEPHGY
jgi:hypothetical protein